MCTYMYACMYGGLVGLERCTRLCVCAEAPVLPNVGGTDQHYSYSTQTWTEVPGLLLRVILVAALVSSSFLVQLVAICIAYWAFKQRKPCGCCYDNAGVPNCPSAQRASSIHPSPSPL